MARIVVQVVLVEDQQLVCVPDESVVEPGDTIQWVSPQGRNHGGFSTSPLEGLADNEEWATAAQSPVFTVKTIFGQFKYHVMLELPSGLLAGAKFFVDPKVIVKRPT